MCHFKKWETIGHGHIKHTVTVNVIFMQMWMNVPVELVGVIRSATTTMALTHALVVLALHLMMMDSSVMV